MPYKSKSELPDNVQNVLPAHAQDIYKEVFNSARDQYKDKEDRRDDASREETAHKVARAAVKMTMRKGMMTNGTKRNSCRIIRCLHFDISGG